MATLLGNKLYEMRLNKEKADKDREIEKYKADTQRTGLGSQLLGSLGSAMIKAVARRQDKSWHTRTLAGFAGSPTFANPPTGTYTFTDYEGVNHAFKPVIGYALKYRLLLGASLINSNENDSNQGIDFTERNASSLGIARLYDKIRDKIGYSNNYDSVYLGQQIFIIRNLIVVLNELKKLYRAATTLSDSNPAFGLSIVADYWNEWGFDNYYTDPEELRNDIRNNKANFVTTFNDLVDRFNELVSIPQGFALLLRSAFMAENVFLDNKYAKTPIPYHFIQPSITVFNYADTMLNGSDFAYTVEIKDFLKGESLELNNSAFAGVQPAGNVNSIFEMLGIVIDQFVDQTFRNLMGDIKSKFTSFWHEEHLNVDEKLEVTYSEEVNQFVHNATVCGRLVKPKAGAKLRQGIYGSDGNIYQGYPTQTYLNDNLHHAIYSMPLMFSYDGNYDTYNSSILYTVTSDITDMLFNEFDNGDLILASSLQNIMTGCRAELDPDGSPVQVYAFCPAYSRIEIVEYIKYTLMSEGKIESYNTVGVVSGRILKQMSVLPINFKHRGGNENNNGGLVDYNVITMYDVPLAASLCYKDKTSLLDFFTTGESDSR